MENFDLTDNFIDLTDGTRLEIKTNFGTLFYLEQCGGNRLASRIDEAEKSGKKASEFDNVKMASKIIFAVLRSNGLKVTEEEAMALVPFDMEVIEKILNVFAHESEKQKKKQQAKANMKKMMSH